MPPHSKILGMGRAEELEILFQEFISENSDKIDQIKQEIKIMKSTQYETDEEGMVSESIENLENEITKKNMRIDFMKIELPDVSNSIKILRSISVSMKLEKRIHFANRDNNSPVWANYEMHEQEIVDENLLKLSKDNIEKIKGDDKQIRKMINLCI